MKTILAVFVLSAALLFAADEKGELPIKEGETYSFSVTAEHLKRPESKFKVIRILRYPWVEVEMTWTSLNDMGGGKIERERHLDTFYLNMDEVVTIRSLDVKATSGNR